MAGDTEGDASASVGPSGQTPGSEQDLLASVRYFESRIDQSNAEQVEMLQRMKEQVRRLRQLRGDWDKPSNDRDWNDETLPLESKAPMAIDSFRCDGLVMGIVVFACWWNVHGGAREAWSH